MSTDGEPNVRTAREYRAAEPVLRLGDIPIAANGALRLEKHMPTAPPFTAPPARLRVPVHKKPRARRLVAARPIFRKDASQAAKVVCKARSIELMAYHDPDRQHAHTASSGNTAFPAKRLDKSTADAIEAWRKRQ